VKRTFGAFGESVGEARRFVTQTISDLPIELQDSVSLMVSELATNALVHASSGFDVSVDRSVASVTISVADRGDGTPAIQSPSSNEPHGRGLRIVATLSDDWGISSTAETGKTVWFRMSFRRTRIPRREVDMVAAQEGRADHVNDEPAKQTSMTLPGTGEADRPNARHGATRRNPPTPSRMPTCHRSLASSAIRPRLVDR
jgi:anti-sigma regulatory factor (Ser/Thr protein kinase)